MKEFRTPSIAPIAVRPQDSQITIFSMDRQHPDTMTLQSPLTKPPSPPHSRPSFDTALSSQPVESQDLKSNMNTPSRAKPILDKNGKAVRSRIQSAYYERERNAMSGNRPFITNIYD